MKNRITALDETASPGDSGESAALDSEQRRRVAAFLLQSARYLGLGSNCRLRARRYAARPALKHSRLVAGA
jgi:hypothetical protein